MCGRGSGDCAMPAGRAGRVGPRFQIAGACDAIASWCLELWTLQVGQTAMLAAANHGHRDVVGLLLDRGANMKAKTRVSQPLPSSPNLPGRAVRLSRAHCHLAGPQPRRVVMAAARGALQRGRVQQCRERAVVDVWAWVR